MIFTTQDQKIAYYHAPKCGSRTVLGYIALCQEPTLFETNPGFFKERNDDIYGGIRSRALKHPLSQHDWPAPNHQVPKVHNVTRAFCVTRDPVERFVSGYRNRILFHDEIPNKPPIGKFIREFGKFASKYRTVRTHFAPQVAFYGKDRRIFTDIFNIKRMDEVREMFEEEYGVKIPDIQLQQGGNDIKVELTRAETEWIKDKYSLDYKLGWC